MVCSCPSFPPDCSLRLKIKGISRKDAKKREERKEHQSLGRFSLRPLRFFAPLREAVDFEVAAPP
jgi:hypothetical protein